MSVVRGEDLVSWRSAAETSEFVALIGTGVEVTGEDWIGEALGIFELHPESVIVSGRLRDTSGKLIEAGLELDPGSKVLNPHRGKLISDPGYFGQLWKQRTVGAASAQLAIVQSQFLLEVLADLSEPRKFAQEAGSMAAQRNARVVYSPFIEGLCRSGSDSIS